MRSPEQRVAAAVNRRIRKGEPFAVDSIWDGLPDLKPGDHMNWVGKWIRELAEAGTIQPAGFAVTPRSKPHSRTVNLWQGRPAEQSAA